MDDHEIGRKFSKECGPVGCCENYRRMLRSGKIEYVKVINDSEEVELFRSWEPVHWMSLICKMKMRLRKKLEPGPAWQNRVSVD